MKKLGLKVFVLIGVITLGANANAQSAQQRKPSPEKVMERLDTNKDGSLDKEEVKKAKKGKLFEHFDKIDKDSDGLISIKELTAVFDKSKK
jgi:Ca2+-binding EF-hand superfamily protein